MDNQKWTLEIEPRSKLTNVDLKEIWRYRDLIFLFVRRDFVAQYKQTILGPLWFILQPVLTTFVFTVIFGSLAGLAPSGVSGSAAASSLYYLAGVTCWTYFADCLIKTSNTFANNAAIFGKVYFPRLIVPISVVVSNLIKFGIQMGLFLITYFTMMASGVDVKAGWQIALLPLLMLIMAALGLGFGAIISSLTTKYRDLKFLTEFGVRLAMYASTVIIPLEKARAGGWDWILEANPMTGIIETFRIGFLGEGNFEWKYIWYSMGVAVTVLIVGVVIFRRVEKNFMDTV